jgi:carboxyl-terminal processing protease
MRRLTFGSLILTACATVATNGTRADEQLAPGIALASFDTLWTVVQRTYVDTAFVAKKWVAVRDSLRPRAAAITTRSELDRLFAETLSKIPDSHFYIIPARVASEVSERATAGEGTTGISVRIAGDRAVVWRVEPGSPGARAGIRPGQSVEKVKDRVAAQSIKRVMSLPDASRQRALSEVDFNLNGALSPSVGDTVRIRLSNPGEKSAFERLLFAVPVHGTISKFGNLPPIAGIVRYARLPLVPGASDSRCIGTVSFNVWLPALAPEISKAVESVADCAGIVIDLRGNPGGVGAMVMGFGGYFVDSLVSLGTMRTRDLSLNFTINPRRLHVNGHDTGPFKGKVAILTDPMTASTSEIFATGMQRIGRARVFGERSATAALPALMQRLPSEDVFVHAVADFVDPSGGRIEGAGVIPDELVLLTQADLSKNIDAPLQAAMHWIASSTASPSVTR